jgi:formylglycine-generating enzyme required for sulfatase activity
MSVYTGIISVAATARPIGTGFVISRSGLVATSSQVIEAANGAALNFVPLHSPGQVQAGVASLRLRFTDLRDEAADVALLQIEDPLHLDEIPVAPLLTAEAIQPDMAFYIRGFGLPGRPDLEGQVQSVTGTVVGIESRLVDGQHIRFLRISSEESLAGLAGSPVVVEALEGVAGIVSQPPAIDSEQPTPGKHLAWAISVEHIVRLNPNAISMQKPVEHTEAITHVAVEIKNRGVFLSYKSENRDFVRRVYEELKLRGVKNIWMDQLELKGGDVWKQEITSALDTRDCLIVFVSRLALESEEVRFEYEYALDKGKYVLPVLIERGLSEEHLPPRLRALQLIRMTPDDDFNISLVQILKSQKLPRHAIEYPTMLPVEEGEFVMGRPGKFTAVEVGDFWIGKCPVTTVQFSLFVEGGGLRNPEYWPPSISAEELATYSQMDHWPDTDVFNYAMNYPSRPMSGVTWHQAYAFCQWLSYQVGIPGAFRLPTEAEWEKAARGTDRRTYPWGSTWRDHMANTLEAAIGGVTDCGYFGEEACSPYGCCDMAGNVWEWTLTQPYSGLYADDGRNLVTETDAPRRLRGGSWQSNRSNARTYHQVSDNPIPIHYRYQTGFRVVASQDPTLFR